MKWMRSLISESKITQQLFWIKAEKHRGRESDICKVKIGDGGASEKEQEYKGNMEEVF